MVDNKGCGLPLICFMVGSCNGQLILLFEVMSYIPHSNQFAYHFLVKIFSVVLVNFQGIPFLVAKQLKKLLTYVCEFVHAS